MTTHPLWLTIWITITLSALLGSTLVVRRTRHEALGWALLVASLSLALGGALLNRFWTDPVSLWVITHISAGLCLAWSIFAWLIRHRFTESTRRRDVLAVINIAALTCGMIAAIVLIYCAAFEAAYRTFGYDFFFLRPRRIPQAGLIDLGVIAAAAVVSWHAHRDRNLISVVYWLGILAAIWCGLLVPSVYGQHIGDRIVAAPTDWPLTIMMLSAVTSVLFAFARRLIVLRRRFRAWPDRMENLTTPLPTWPGMTVSLSIVAVGVATIACLMLTHSWSVAAATLMAAALFLYAQEARSNDLAEIAMVLITIAVAACALVGMEPLQANVLDYPSIFRRLLIALGIMIFFWHWLGAFWQQQRRDDGNAWTTAGRLIPITQRTGYMIAAIAVLVAFQLAAWPAIGPVNDPDRSGMSWTGGLTAHALVLAAIAYAALRTGKPTLAWLSLFVVGALVAFVHFRAPGSGVHLWTMRHGPLLLALTAPIFAALPSVLRLNERNPYREVLMLASLTVAPMGAVILLMGTEYSQLAGRWITPATVLTIVAWYVLALLVARRQRRIARSGSPIG